MPNSMTGFGSKEGKILSLGKVSVELRSTNHKFLDAVFHLPDGFLSLEERVKKEIEAKIERGRVTCVINVISKERAPCVFINRQLLKNYIFALKNIKDQFHIKDELRLDTLMHLPGILSLAESRIPSERIWPHLKILINQALDDLVRMRRKEGQATGAYLTSRSHTLNSNLKTTRAIFKKVIKDRVSHIKTDDERASFLKETDITEELERLTFHIRNFKDKLSKNCPIGKELDFITQEMQREANTIGAKSCNAAISSRVVSIKSQIEKLREQVQNIE